ncbi:MAG: S8 family serine peptidase [Bacteroidota bacterium]
MKTLLSLCVFLLLYSSILQGQNALPSNHFCFLKFQNDISLSSITFNNGGFEGQETWQKELHELEQTFPLIAFRSAFKFPDTSLQHIFLIEFEGSFEDYQSAYSGLKAIEYIEKVPSYGLFLSPNDLNSGQYNVSITSAENAWDISTGNPNVKIAIVDDAFRMDHEDLTGNIWINSAEIPGNGIDDDGNGYVDDINGWDASDNDNDPNPDIFSNNSWTHGTHVAGIAAASTNNGIGIASIGFNCTFIPIKAASNGSGQLPSAYSGIDYALATDAQIISMSWGGSAFSNTYQLLFEVAHNQGKVCVAAAGNSNTSVPMYPASYEHVISVGATDANDVRAGFSNYGNAIDVMAPGVDILSCLAGSLNSYGELSGTSMACPFVSGLCGLMISNNPGMSPEDVEYCLESSCDNIDAQNASFVGQIGAGRVNAQGALACAPIVSADFEADINFVCPGYQVAFADLSTNDPSSWNWTFPGGSPASSTLQNPFVTYNNPGVYGVELVVSNPDGSDELIIADFITVDYPSAELGGSAIITDGMTAYLNVNFQGNPPFSFELSDGTNPQLFTGIYDNPFQIAVQPVSSASYNILNFADQSCAGSGIGEAIITVLPQPAAFECFYSNLYGNSSDNHFIDNVINPIDNSIYAVGRESDNGVLAHINTDGSLDWVKGYSTGISATSMVRCPNGDLIFVMHRSLPVEGDIHVYRVDPNGDILWDKKYELSYDRYPKICPSLGDTYFVCAWTSAGGSSDNVLLMKIDGNGDIIWHEVMDELDDQMFDLQPDEDGGCYITGGAHAVGGNGNYFLIHYDTDGNIIQKAEFDTGTIWDDNPRLTQTQDGGIAICGQTGQSGDKDVFVSKLDSDWNHEWSFEIDFPLDPNLGYDVIDDDDGNIYFIVRENDGAFTKAYVLKMDLVGNIIYSKRLDDVQGGRLKYNNNGGSNSLVFSGFVDPIAQGFGERDAVVIHTDLDFNSCLTSEWTPNMEPLIWTSSDWPISTSSPPVTVTDLNTSIIEPSFEIVEFCTTDCGDTCSVESSFISTIEFLCEPGALSFNNSSVNAENYFWAVNGITVDSTLNFEYFFDQNGLFEISLIAQDEQCFDLFSDTIEVDILNTSIGPSIEICQNDSAQLNASGGSTYFWSPSIGLSSSFVQNPMAAPISSTLYSVSISNGNCTRTESVQIDVDEDCCLTFPSFEFDPDICANELLEIVNTTNANGMATYNWDFGDAFLPSTFEGPTPPLLQPNQTGQIEISLNVSDDCGQFTESLFVNVFPMPLANAGNDTLLCEGQFLQLGSSPIVDMQYSWNPSAGLNNSGISNPEVTIDQDVTYELIVEDLISGCISSDEVSVQYFVFPILDLSPVKCDDDTLLVQLNIDAALNSIIWSNGNRGDSIYIIQEGPYWYQIENSCGQFQEGFEIENLPCSCDIYSPNAITPNADGLNDVFLPVITCPVRDYRLEVWNRWGQKVFETDDPEKGWNASMDVNEEYYVANEIYVWRLNFSGYYKPLENTVDMHGHITVIR